jgi:para-aminobenzoate synthetase/4-amino-4-deoxychorismate lyase
MRYRYVPFSRLDVGRVACLSCATLRAVHSAEDADGALLVFDFADTRGHPRRLSFARPRQILAAHSAAEVLPVIAEARRAADAGRYAAGYVAYEAAPAFDAALAVRPDCRLPLAWFAIFDEPLGRVFETARGNFSLSEWTPSISRADYGQNVAAAREAIARGDTYQINYTFRLRSRFRGDAFALYERLASAQRARYCAYLDTGRHRIVSASPELFFRFEDGRVITRPMKGTARRGLWEEDDEARALALVASDKNRAENVMIVDLLRNDLGRVTVPGSVRVTNLCRVERYPTVFQLTSEVAADARPGTRLEDVFSAAFPSGSVTGAPKVSTTRLIAALEDSPRNIYCGAVGVVEPGGRAVFNVAIRTVLIDAASGEAEYGVGGGITWDSEAADEYDEALAKASVLSEAGQDFRLLETLRLEGGVYARLERHVRRMLSSARYFDFPISEDRLSNVLCEHASRHPLGARRARLLLSANGEAHVESETLAEWPGEPVACALALAPVSRADRFLYHKTTRRDVYEARRAESPSAFDVLLWNGDGEVTEFTLGNAVVELGGRLYTPPRESGLLAGTMRAEMIERGEAAERIITLHDLARSSRLWLVNSVRGRVAVTLG